MAQGTPQRPQLRFQVWPGHASPKGGQVALFVESAQPVQPAQVNCQHRGRARPGVDMPHHTRSTAVGNHLRARALGELQQRPHLTIRLRVGHPIRKRADVAAAQGDPVGHTLAAGVGYAPGRVGFYQRVRRQPRGRHAGHHVRQAHILWRSPRPHPFQQKLAAPGRERIIYRTISPSIPSSHESLRGGSLSPPVNRAVGPMAPSRPTGAGFRSSPPG